MSDNYFDLHVTGIGYLNRAREVQGARGEPFLAVEVSALHGAMDDVQRTRFDCRVSGASAKTAVRRLMPDIQLCGCPHNSINVQRTLMCSDGV